MKFILYRSHLSKKHQQTGYEQDDKDKGLDEDAEIDYNHLDYNEEYEEPCQPASLEVDTRKQREALFILKIKEERMLTQTALNALLIDIKGSYYMHRQMPRLQVNLQIHKYNLQFLCTYIDTKLTNNSMIVNRILLS